jgi:hypothetical protein
MGIFGKRVAVSNANEPDPFFEEEFWGDTGAPYSFVPEDCRPSISVGCSIDLSS